MSLISDAVLQRLSSVTQSDPSVLVSFAYGSIIEGMSNKSSDLDVCLVTRNVESLKIEKIDDVEVDLESIPLEVLKSKIISAGSNEPSEYAILWCHRIMTSEPVFGDQNILKELKESINIESMKKKLSGWYCALSLAFSNDSLGALESGDLVTAFITARLGVETAALAYLSSNGIINPKTKWIYKYLIRLREKDAVEIAEQFRLLELAGGKGPNEIKDYVSSTLGFVSRLTLQAQV